DGRREPRPRGHLWRARRRRRLRSVEGRDPRDARARGCGITPRRPGRGDRDGRGDPGDPRIDRRGRAREPRLAPAHAGRVRARGPLMAPDVLLPVGRFLDALRAAEAAGAEVLAAWIGVCELDGLRGGLRAIAEREAAHAELLAERLAELGLPCTAALAQSV